MVDVISLAQREKVAELFVRVSPPLQGSKEEKQRLVDKGVSLTCQQLDVADMLFMQSGTKVYTEMHSGAKLPGSPVPVQVVESSEKMGGMERPVITVHIAADAPDVDQLFEGTMLELLDHRVDPAEHHHEVHGGHPSIIRTSEVPIPKETKSKPRKGRYEVLAAYDTNAGPDHTRIRRNTARDLIFYRHMRDAIPLTEAKRGDAEDIKWAKATRLEWEWRLGNLFDEDGAYSKQSPRDWLRSLRVLNGLLTADMGAFFGKSQNAYSSHENHHDALQISQCFKCLEHNIFNLPMDQKDPQVVDSDYAQKFMRKMGHPQTFIPRKHKAQLEAALKARAIAGFTVPFSDTLDAHDVLYALMEGEAACHVVPNGHPHLKEWRRFRGTHNLHGVTAKSDYLFVQPRSAYSTQNTATDLHAHLAERYVLDIAEQADSIGDFLHRYYIPAGLQIKDIRQQLGVSRQAIQQYHAAEHFLPTQNGKEGVLEKIIRTNAYHFPTEHGHVHPEVVQALHALNNEKNYCNPYITADQAATKLQLKIIQPLAPTSAAHDNKARSRIYQETFPYVAFKKYWQNMERQYQKNGTLRLASEPARCWEDPWGHLMLHGDDVALIAKDPAWQKAYYYAQRACKHPGEASRNL